MMNLLAIPHQIQRQQLKLFKHQRPAVPQKSLCIDKDTLEKAERASEANKLSTSKWVGKQLNKSLKDDCSVDFENLFSSIIDESFTVPQRYK